MYFAAQHDTGITYGKTAQHAPRRINLDGCLGVSSTHMTQQEANAQRSIQPNIVVSRQC